MSNSAKFGNLFDTIFNTATQVLPFVTNNNNPRQQNVSITSAITALVLQLNQLETGFAALNPTQRLQAASQALQGVQAIQQQLNTLQGTGTDAQYLANQKQVAANVLTHIQTMIQEAQAALANNNTPTSVNTQTTTQQTINTQTPVQLPSGQIVYVQTPVQNQSNSFELDNTTKQIAIYGGIGLLAYLLLKK